MFDKYTVLLCADLDYTSTKVKSQYVIQASEHDLRSPESLGRAALHTLDLDTQMRCTRIDLVQTNCDDPIPIGHWLKRLQGSAFIIKDGVVTRYLRPRSR